MNYNDGAGYWDAIRAATKIVIQDRSSQLSHTDCIALMGKMNLGVGQFGAATEEALEPKYLEWTPRMIAKRLRPKLLVVVGMKTLLKNNKTIQNLLGEGLGVNFADPDCSAPFHYTDNRGEEKNLGYDIWGVEWQSEVNVSATIVL